MKKYFLFIALTLLSFTTKMDPYMVQKSKGSMIVHKSYILCFDLKMKTTLWTSYNLTSDMVVDSDTSICKRSNDFRADEKLLASPKPADYAKSGYDRGHLVNCQDMTFSEVSESQSFYMTNMTPQDPSFNRGIWKTLENKTREYAMRRGSVYVITGPIFRCNTKEIKRIGKTQVPVPTHCYKIIFDPISKKAIAYILENSNKEQTLKDGIVNIDQVEKETDIDFLFNLPDDVENIVESTTLTKF